MPQADFAYAPANDLARLPLAASIFADSPDALHDLREDVEAAGLAVQNCAPLAVLYEGEPRALGEVVLLDCPHVDGAALAALARLDMRVARAGAQLVIATSIAALDGVFACCDQCVPQILVDPSHAERVVALGRAVARASGSRLRELSHDDRLTLLRLTEQVDQIVDRLGRLGAPGFATGGPGQACLKSPQRDFTGPGAGGRQLVLPPRPALPDPRQIRQIIRRRQLRGRFFDAALFADPAWDILLDLAAARAEHKRVSVSSLCIASGVPPTTALRWIGQLTVAGLLERFEDETDRRRAFIALSDEAAEAMARYFAAIGSDAPWVA